MIDNNYNKDLNFDSYKQYVNNTGKYGDTNQIAQYNNFYTEMGNYKGDIRMSTVMLDYLNNNKLENIDNSLNDMRQIDINNYYTAKYNKESNILKQIIFYCCLALVGSLFFLKGLITETLYIVYLAIIIFIGFSAVLYSLYNLYMRDSIVFDEYDYPYLKAPGNDISYHSVEIKDTDDKKCL
uniref:Uncharacterized protein n=1 Tax=viral metagenome TaxID=1070528 RepID=A0A6C0ETQ4_9ZZZZ